MLISNHTLGFPRIGFNRELKIAQEKYWSGNLELKKLLDIGSEIRQKNWKKQKDSGIDYIPVGDFSWYDHVLTTSMMLGNIPERHQDINHCSVLNLDCLFRIARGASPNISASEMTKWFNTNYHYIVPEFSQNTTFKFSWKQLLEEVDEALLLGYQVKPILLGPMTYLWLGKVKEKNFDRLELLSKILPIYQEILQELSKRNIDFVQIDEPVLVLDLPLIWQKAYSTAYHQLYGVVKLLLTTYFDSIEHNIHFISKLPVQGIHIDLIHGKYDLDFFLSQIPSQWMLSLGVINGRNIWKADLLKWFRFISLLVKKNSDRKFLIGSSCSLLHTPIDLNKETQLTPEIKQCFSFSVQKCIELSYLTTALNTKNVNLVEHWALPLKKYILSNKKNSENIKKPLSNIKFNNLKRISAYDLRYLKQEKKFKFPLFPTTTIGSFPQTSEIRKLRQLFKNKIISSHEYSIGIKRNIKKVIEEQEKLGLDVFVHGEFERNDMVEYFSEHLDGFIFTEYGWVQSYGSRCVKPPIIVSDIQRSQPITLKWIKYAQSCTKKPVKGMLTGPVTMLLWSYPREDISLKDTAMQIALALNDEILDLEKEKITIIQIDEPALREGLPLRKSDWKEYLSWAINAFRLSFIGVKDSTQIHTHMCYSEFNDIMKDIALLDADVITIETARSDMELLESFKKCKYPNSIGPGVYDIHSSNIPTVSSINILIKKAIKYIPINRIWINPDCGLKTRNWDETKLALKNMIQATQKLRKHFSNLNESI